MNSILKMHKPEIIKMVSEMEAAVVAITAQRKILEDVSSTLYSMFEDVSNEEDDEALNAIELLPEDVDNLDIDEIAFRIDSIKEGLENG